MKLAEVSIRRPVLAAVMVGSLAVFGAWAYPSVGVDLFPEVDFPIVVVTAVYPGADPETIESKVVLKLEEAVSTINGLKMLRSTSMENVGLVVLQFELERDAAQVIQDVRDKVAGVQRSLPADLEPPVVQRFDVSSAPVLALAVFGPLDTRELTRVADEQVKQRLQAINGVGGVDLVGGRERQFHVWIDPQRLEAYGLTAPDVMMALAAQNVEVPGGRLDIGTQEVTVKTLGQVHDVAGLEELVLTSAMGAPIRLVDIARIEDGEEEARSYSSLNGQAAVSLVVRKQSGANTVAVADAVRAELGRIAKMLPAGVAIDTPVDNSTFIRNTIHDVQFDLLYGGILAILIIFFFLHDWRATLISALALPISVVATFAFIRAMGFTFNLMTMLALSLSIGILIDDAIVVIENIHRHLRLGKPPSQAAGEGTGEIGLAVMATTASIVAVFVPVAFMKGMIGQFFLQFGLTVAFAVSISLFVAFTLTPMMAARLLTEEVHQSVWSALIDRWLAVVDRAYRRALRWSLDHRWTTVAAATLVLFSSLGLGAFVNQEFMPSEDRGQFLVKIELPAGTGFATTTALAEQVAEELRGLPGVTLTFVTVGGGEQPEINRAEVNVNMVGKNARTFSQAEMIDYVRRHLAGRTGALFAVEPVQMVGGGGAAFRAAMVQYAIFGADYNELNRAASALTDHLIAQGGYVDLDTSFRGGKPELALRIDRDRAADLGVPLASIGMTVRSLVAGDKATEIATDGDRFDVQVRLDAGFRQGPADLLGLKVRNGTGQLIHLANLVDVAAGTGPGKIERQDRQRQVTLFANLSDKTLGEAVQEIEAWSTQNLTGTLYGKFVGMGEVMKESFANLWASLLLAIIIVFLILAAQFDSFIHPFTIMLSLPLSVVGALGALLLAGEPLGIMAMIGLILLMGLVTKNAILLVDYTNTLRLTGMAARQALETAGPVRLRPILMTTAAMIFGMIPVALAFSEGGEMRAPMAVAVIGGLITSTILTLVVVPVAYLIVDGTVENLRAWWEKPTR